MIEFVECGGGLVFAYDFIKQMTEEQFDDIIRGIFGLQWKLGKRMKGKVEVNRKFRLLGHWTPEKFPGYDLGSRDYLPSSLDDIESITMEEVRPPNQVYRSIGESDSTEVPIAMTNVPVGHGLIGWQGDLCHSKDTLKILLAMLALSWPSGPNMDNLKTLLSASVPKPISPSVSGSQIGPLADFTTFRSLCLDDMARHSSGSDPAAGDEGGNLAFGVAGQPPIWCMLLAGRHGTLLMSTESPSYRPLLPSSTSQAQPFTSTSIQIRILEEFGGKVS